MSELIKLPTTPASEGRPLGEAFRRFSQRVAQACGSPWAFLLGVAIVVGWAVTGRLFDYSESWQLVINTGTTIVTFLMVFVIQNTQSRDSRELHLKLDELLRAIENARNTVINCADVSDKELEQMTAELQSCAPPAHKASLIKADGTPATNNHG